MPQYLTDSRLANIAAGAIHEGFREFQRTYKEITRRAKTRFERRDWTGMQADASERLDLYRKIVDQLVTEIEEMLEDRVQEKLVWASMKAVYSSQICDRDDWELAETFFNSITRRIFTTVGVNHQIEFVNTDFETPPTQSRPVCRGYQRASSTAVLIQNILQDYQFEACYEDLDRDIALVEEQIDAHLKEVGALRMVDRAEVAESVFYRGKAAYIIGRLFSGAHLIPMVLSLIHTTEGIIIDAVLLTENEVSILFSFARSYFHVDVERPYDLIAFLKTIMPRKRIAELYISIGFNKHGKTELYRDILQHLAYSTEQFEIARGEKGMVMTVFTMPGYDLVFKLIKDRFAYPKRTTKKEVRQKYRLVFKRDRAGRLVDAQEFEHLKFDRGRFSGELLDELKNTASEAISIKEDHIVLKHAYVERRVSPLNLYIGETSEDAAIAAILDYGSAIKDMAYTNIFAGDLWLKNFGVTRHGRVVFYDYDELTLLTECNFRKMPPSRHYEDELAAEPWFAVGENDIFPEEFENFLGFHGRLREAFMEQHADLLNVKFWRKLQQRLEEGEVIHFFPYKQKRRLHDPPKENIGV